MKHSKSHVSPSSLYSIAFSLVLHVKSTMLESHENLCSLASPGLLSSNISLIVFTSKYSRVERAYRKYQTSTKTNSQQIVHKIKSKQNINFIILNYYLTGDNKKLKRIMFVTLCTYHFYNDHL